MNYKNIRLDKSMYKADGGFSTQLEKIDPSANYKDTDLAGLDAYERQLKRFDIKVSGGNSDTISKFFATSDSAALFPEYVSRSVATGVTQEDILKEIVASNSVINSLDYRSITSSINDNMNPIIAEGAQLPTTTITLNDHLVKLKKRGRIFSASYEVIKHQRADVLTVALAQIGCSLAKAQLNDALKVLAYGEGSIPAAETTTLTAPINYDNLLDMWSKFGDFEMNVILASPKRVKEIMSIPEIYKSTGGDGFISGGGIITPFGAKLLKTTAVPDDMIIALDKRFALEMVTTGGIQVEYDKLIDTQLERAAISTTYGFSKLFNDAVKVLELDY